MGTLGWSSKCVEMGTASAGLAAAPGVVRHTRHVQAHGHASSRAQRQNRAQPVGLSLESSSEAPESKRKWSNLKRGWLQAGAGVSCAAAVAANVVPLLSQSNGDGGTGDGNEGGGGGGGDGDGSGGNNHLYDLSEAAEQG